MVNNLFIRRPVLTIVLSLTLVLAGIISLLVLPVAKLPPVLPPTVEVKAVYPGASAEDNADGDISADIQIDSSAVDTTTAGTYSVLISVGDSSGNKAELTRTVIVEFRYAGWTGIIPTKTTVKVGSSNPLLWAWLDEYDNPVDSSGDVQLLTIRNCSTNAIILQMAGDPGSSGFRYKSDDYSQFNWDSEGTRGEKYCAVVESTLTGQAQGSPPIRLR